MVTPRLRDLVVVVERGVTGEDRDGESDAEDEDQGDERAGDAEHDVEGRTVVVLVADGEVAVLVAAVELHVVLRKFGVSCLLRPAYTPLVGSAT